MSRFAHAIAARLRRRDATPTDDIDMTDTPTLPPELAGLDPDRLVDVDVREELRAGQEPFARIMAARQTLRPDQVLRVRAIFEPAPLYHVLGRQGLDHWTEKLADDDWRVWFYAAAAPAAPPSAVSGAEATEASEADGDVVILDVRGLEPPEPMMRTLAALETLGEGQTLVQLNVRVPRFLLPKLEERGYRYEVREQSDELVRLFIRRA